MAARHALDDAQLREAAELVVQLKAQGRPGDGIAKALRARFGLSLTTVRRMRDRPSSSPTALRFATAVAEADERRAAAVAAPIETGEWEPVDEQAALRVELGARSFGTPDPQPPMEFEPAEDFEQAKATCSVPVMDRAAGIAPPSAALPSDRFAPVERSRMPSNLDPNFEYSDPRNARERAGLSAMPDESVLEAEERERDRLRDANPVGGGGLAGGLSPTQAAAELYKRTGSYGNEVMLALAVLGER